MNNLTLFQNTLHSFSFRTANDLYTPGKNFVFSPASLSYGLGLLLEGTGGLSRKEIINSLIDPRFGGDEKSAEKASEFLVELGRGHPKGIQKLVSSANFVYANKSCKLNENYMKSVKEKYSATARALDFKNANAEAMAIINKDVEMATKGLIPDFLKSLELDIVAMLVNAIHFKGLWAEPFKKDNTVMERFHLSNGETIKVPMMNNYRGVFVLGHCPKTGSKLLRLPYTSGTKDEQIYMVFVLPPTNSNVKNYLANFNLDDFNHTLDLAEFRYMDISIPRFKIKSTHSELKRVLKSSGIRQVFSDTADLSKMSALPLTVSDIIQKAVIEVNEEGTEAAGVTGIRMVALSAREISRPSFHANRPFVYALITENKNKLRNILFVGAVENPIQ